MMNTLLSVDWWDLEGILVPFFSVVLLPAIIIFFAATMNKRKVESKTRIMLAAIEKGVELDPAFYTKPRKSAEEKLHDRFLGGMIVGLIGLAFILIGAFTASRINLLSLLFFIPGGIMFAIGGGLVASFIVGRKSAE